MIIILAFFSIPGQSETTSPVKNTAVKKTDSTPANIRFTFLKDCKETIMNDNAAYSEQVCPDLGNYKVSISKQDPQFFNIILKQGAQTATSDFTVVSNEKPIKEGKAIEWHLQNNTPKYMIFRLSWGTDDEPFKMREYLVVNLVTTSEICALATIDIKNNRDANEKARNLLGKEFKNTQACPEKVQMF